MKTIYFILAFFFSISLHASERSTIMDNDSGLVIELAWDKVDVTQAEVDTAVSVLQRRFRNLNEIHISVEYKKRSKSIIVKLDSIDKFEKYKDVFNIQHTISVWETYSRNDIIGLVCNEKEQNTNELKNRLSNLNDTFQNKNLIHIHGLVFIESSGPMIGIVKASDTVILNKRLSGSEAKLNLPHDIKFYYKVSQSYSRISSSVFLELYALKEPENYEPISGNMIELASSGYNMSGSVGIDITLKNKYHKLWSNMTNKNIDQFVAILYNNQLIKISKIILQITDGEFTIDQNKFTEEEGKLIAAIISSGELPFALRVLSVK